MGNARKLRKKYHGPSHPWQKTRIEEEKKVIFDFGLLNKRELWRANSLLKRYADFAKKLISATGDQADKERTQLLQRLQRMGLLGDGAKLDDVLTLTPRDLLERRLQTQVVRKGLARTTKQARQFVTHEHIMVNGKTISSPSYIVLREEESSLAFRGNSVLVNPEHPERVTVTKTGEVKTKETKAKPSEDEIPEIPEEEVEVKIEDDTVEPETAAPEAAK